MFVVNTRKLCRHCRHAFCCSPAEACILLVYFFELKQYHDFCACGERWNNNKSANALQAFPDQTKLNCNEKGEEEKCAYMHVCCMFEFLIFLINYDGQTEKIREGENAI